MDAGLLRDVLTLLLGLLSGILSGVFGIGGAIVTTPGVRLLGASAFLAVGTTLPPIVVSAASGTARYVKEGLVDGRVLLATAPAGLVAVVGGSFASHAIPGEGHWLMVMTAVLLVLSSVRMVGTPEPGSADEVRVAAASRRESTVISMAVGGAAGLLSGLLGIGGGALLVPAYSQVMGLPLKTSIATSLACVGILAVPGTVVHAALGDVDWRLALLLSVAVLPGARLGAVVAIRAKKRRLRLAVAILLGGIGVAYGIGELAAVL